MAFRNGRVLQLRHGRYETAEFFLSAPPGLDTNVAWQALQDFQVPQRLFVILGPVRLLPTGRFPTPVNEAQAVMTDVFYFNTKAGARFQVNCDEAHLLFFRVQGIPNRPLICGPRRGKND